MRVRLRVLAPSARAKHRDLDDTELLVQRNSCKLPDIGLTSSDIETLAPSFVFSEVATGENNFIFNWGGVVLGILF